MKPVRGQVAAMENGDEDWTTVIRPKGKFFDLHLGELIHYRDLVFLFVKRDFVIQYKQTVLGPLWYVIQPLISTVLFIFVFGNLAKISTDGVPYVLFYYGGTMLWSFFESNFKNASDTFSSNADVFNKVYFPRLTVPISRVFINLLALSIQLLLLCAFYAYYLMTGTAVRPNAGIAFFPLLLIWIASLGVGLGLIVSSITTKYRDLKQLVSFGINLWMYATPIVYPLSTIPREYKWLYYLNPVSAPIESFRIAFFGRGEVPAGMMISSAVIAVTGLILGLLFFNRGERTFIDVA